MNGLSEAIIFNESAVSHLSSALMKITLNIQNKIYVRNMKLKKFP